MKTIVRMLTSVSRPDGEMLKAGTEPMLDKAFADWLIECRYARRIRNVKPLGIRAGESMNYWVDHPRGKKK